MAGGESLTKYKMMKVPTFSFSIIIVCLNPGEKLKSTLDSVFMQSFTDYEIIIKDGLSSDGTENFVNPTARFFSQADTGIYDAMNQAVAKAKGQFVYFLNCGDTLYDEQVLAEVKRQIDENESTGIYYGNVYEMLSAQTVHANPHLGRFACYRHLPCHQACFVRRELLVERPFQTEYQVRADYEHFLWCFLEKKAGARYIPLTVARYEGAGFSESKENRRKMADEHRKIVSLYMSKGELFKYRLIMALTLAPLRRALARNKATAGFYQRTKRRVYS
jgi:glycosyltransferase involved in cell wall biosynthesis